MTNPVQHSSQAIDNWSFDEEYQRATVEILTENEAGTALSTQKAIATESTLQAVLAASVGSTYNYIQSEETATYKYYGFTNLTGWQIKRKTLATGVWEISYEDFTGTYTNFDDAWTARADLAYSYA